jgi:ATP-dependent helicase HepA
VPFSLELAIASSMETTLALERHAAVRRALPVLRAGHPLVDAIALQLRYTERGAAFALFRPVRGQWPPIVVLRADFLISTLPDERFLGEADAAGLRSMADQLMRDMFPPLVETVVMTTDGREVTHPALRQPYNKARGDRNLGSRPDLFERLAAHVDWPATCATALPLAQRLLAARSTITERPTLGAAEVRDRLTRQVDRMLSRELAGFRDTDSNSISRLKQVIPACFEPQVDVLGCGVIFVGDSTKVE